MISLGDKEITSDPTKKRKFVTMYTISNRMYGIVVFVHIMAVNLNYEIIIGISSIYLAQLVVYFPSLKSYPAGCANT